MAVSLKSLVHLINTILDFCRALDSLPDARAETLLTTVSMRWDFSNGGSGFVHEL